MNSAIELRHNIVDFCSHDEHIHFNTIVEVDAYLRKQHYLRFTEGHFQVVRCHAVDEDIIQDLIDAYDKRASVTLQIGDRWSKAVTDLKASEDWLDFYVAVRSACPEILELRDKHMEAVRELTKEIEQHKIQYQQLVGE